MNHDSIPTSPAAGLPFDAGDEDDDTGASSSRRADRTRTGDHAQRRAGVPALRRKLHLINDLLHSLDLVIAAELCTLYYLDCSFFFLVMRWLAQTFFMSPKSDDFVHLMPGQRQHVFMVFGPNLLCFLLHAFAPLPQGSEAARGYLHGGILVDFIGQKAPTSKLSLLALDILVLALQCLMLTVHAEANKLRNIIRPSEGSNTATAPTSAPVAPTVEDLDAEERGIPRNGTSLGAGADDIEMQPLNPRRNEDSDDHSHVPGESSQRAAALSDVLWSGDVNLADLHVIHTVRTAGNDYRSAAAHSIQGLGYAAHIARAVAESRATQEAQRGRTLGP